MKNKAKICCSRLTRALLPATIFSNPQQIFLLRDKLITQGEKRETSTQDSQRNNFARKAEGFCIMYLRVYLDSYALSCVHQVYIQETPEWLQSKEQTSVNFGGPLTTKTPCLCKYNSAVIFVTTYVAEVLYNTFLFRYRFSLERGSF